jgi:putative tryptophan/tyrosine transport system substrate-binding protein
MKRREFITLLGSAAAGWPLTARAQQSGRMQRVGVLLNLAADDPEGQARLAAFLQGLQEAGWAVGRNLRVDLRWGGGDMERIRKQAADLVALGPDVILASTNQVIVALQQATRVVPIVFAAVTDPVAGGFVESLARPGRNATGFTSAEYSMSAKWLELLKDIAPGVTRAAVLYDARNPGGLPQFAAVQSMAAALGVELTPVSLLGPAEIERALGAFAQVPNGGLIVTRIAEAILHREVIIAAAARNQLPAVYPLRFFASDGGLLSYGPDIVDQHRRAAAYVDRILRGEKPADLPVQAPTKYELVINLKTAKALGIDVPASVLARADEVIE